jgi:UDP-N-acetyl-D-glucosamine dehydrogenase
VAIINPAHKQRGDQRHPPGQRGPGFEATHEMERLFEPDALLICVPMPLNRHREPDLRFVEETAWDIARRMWPGKLISLESTTYPGTTEEVLWLAYAQKRQPAGGKRLFSGLFAGTGRSRQSCVRRPQHPKVVGGVTAACTRRGGPCMPR